MFKPKIDRRAKVRDDANKILRISCAACGSAVMVYQKDGRDQLLRCYLDRIKWPDRVAAAAALSCPECQAILGVPMRYAKEDRFAFRLITGTIVVTKQ